MASHLATAHLRHGREGWGENLENCRPAPGKDAFHRVPYHLRERGRGGTRPYQRLAGWLALALILLSPAAAPAQRAVEATDWRYVLGFYPPPHEQQLKALLEGDRAQPLPDGRYRITGGKLHSFLETGEPQLNVQAPEAFCSQSRDTVNGPGPLHVETADGKFSIEGIGFQWQTNSVLYISNRVHTVVRADLLEGNNSSSSPAGTGSPLQIFSDRFQYTGDSDLAVYREHVRVTGTNLLLTSGILTLKIPRAEHRLDDIQAEQHVIIDFTNTDHEHVHATGGRAFYAAATRVLRVSDHPAWHTDLREGSGNDILVDRTKEIFRTTGQAWLKLNTEAKGRAGFLPQLDLLSTNSAPATNQVVEVRSDNYEFRTNFAVFNHHVHLTQRAAGQVKGTLDCGLLTVSFVGSNQVQRMVAEQDVVLAQEDKAFTGAKAVYTPTNGWLELTGNPAWRDGLRQGKGNRLLVNLTNAELIVRGNASMRVPANEVTPSSSVPGAAAAPTVKPGTNQFADIFAEEYTLRRDRDRVLSHFRGGVYITHTNMNLMCSTMTVRAPLEAKQGATTLTAEGDVQFDLLDQRNQKHHGTGDKLVYTRTITPSATNNIVLLTGTPAVLQTTNGPTGRNSNFTLDLDRGTISGSGAYQFTGFGPALDTNTIRLPKK